MPLLLYGEGNGRTDYHRVLSRRGTGLVRLVREGEMSTSEEIARNLRDAADVVEKLGLDRSRLICVSVDAYDKAKFLVKPRIFRQVCEGLTSVSTYADESIHATGYLVSGHQRYKVSTVVRPGCTDRDYFEDLLEESQCQS